MSKPHYAYRIWGVHEYPGTGKLTLTSVTTKAGQLTGAVWEFDCWETKTLAAECRHREPHPVPTVGCECGIYAYPDLFDALRLIEHYCGESTYAFGLVSGYGGLNNDGNVVVHDACTRFAAVEIEGFATIGSAWRNGWLGRISQRLDVPLMSLDDLAAKAAGGERSSRKNNRKPGTRYLDEIALGETVSIAISALLCDRSGRLYLRNDREVCKPSLDERADHNRLIVTKERDGRFRFHYQCQGVPERTVPLLPFDGTAELSGQETRLAGAVSRFRMTAGADYEIKARVRRGAVMAPNYVRYAFLDLMNPGDRLEVRGPLSLSFSESGRVRINRILIPHKSADDAPLKFFVSKASDAEYEVDIVANRLTSDWWPSSHTRSSAETDTLPARVFLNGHTLPGGTIPTRWLARRAEAMVEIKFRPQAGELEKGLIR